jgi:hypothetical protein
VKIAGSFGLFYDLMKYALPQGSFGGAKWKDYYYALISRSLILPAAVTARPGRVGRG